MTVLVQYLPAVTAWTGNRAPSFTFESIGATAIEVWMETETAVVGTFDRELMSTQDYSLILGGQAPAYQGGIVVLSGVIPDTVDQISIERNTPITQVADFTKEPFYMDSIEQAFDKQTMIVQELAYKKCNGGIAGDITQELEFNRYRVLYTDSLNFAVNKLVAYMLEMDTNGAKCGDSPGQVGLFDTGQIDARGRDIGYAGIYPAWVTL